ncbi:MAG: hypothetical protein N3G74_02310, partial [Candidatus Micrarchaeota archaeon]|nr:hypothetical protein [Candidatus Micrarchaeota archaeon]
YSIQVKTITKKQNYWPIGRKPENSKSHYYIFVRAIRKDVPEFYIVKSSKVIKNAESNKSWGHGQIYYIKRNAIAKDRENWKQLEG